MRPKTIAAASLALALSCGQAFSAPPSFWHYYHAYSKPVQTCGMLIKEAMQNLQQNWDLDGGDVNATNAKFVSGNTRGYLRCLSRGSNKSWVVIITSGGGGKARRMYDDLKVVICGDC